MATSVRRVTGRRVVAERTAGLVVPGLLLGIGLGGFVDGIVLHQLLQWHHLVSSAVPPSTLDALRFNVLWDGIFHSITWLATVAGIVLLWAAVRHRGAAWRTSQFFGSVLAGWGIFNLTDGLLNHHLLGIHHINETVPPEQWLAWDLGFLAFGLAMLAVGWWLARLPAQARAGDAG